MSRFNLPVSLRSLNVEEERHASWLEIFFDLIFAVIIIRLSSRLLNHLDLRGILECIFLFIPIMWTWVSYTIFAARFDNNDGLHWLMTFIIMFSGAVMAIQIPLALGRGANGFAVGFLISQLSLLFLYFRTLYDPSTPRKMTLLYLIGFGAGTSFWITSLFFNMPTKFILWSLGMVVYLLTLWLGRKNILSKAPLNPVYIPERFGAFTVIILGQAIAAVVFGLDSANWNFLSTFMCILAFSLAVLIWLQYYTFSQIADYRCTLGSGQPYVYSHIPLIISLMIIGVCTEDFIRATDTIHENVNLIFCFAISVYLLSYYLLNYIAVKKVKISRNVYVGGVMAICPLFIFRSLQPIVILSYTVVIFIILFVAQDSVLRHVDQKQ